MPLAPERARLLSVVDLADDRVVAVADDLDVGTPRRLLAGGAFV